MCVALGVKKKIPTAWIPIKTDGRESLEFQIIGCTQAQEKKLYGYINESLVGQYEGPIPITLISNTNVISLLHCKFLFYNIALITIM